MAVKVQNFDILNLFGIDGPGKFISHTRGDAAGRISHGQIKGRHYRKAAAGDGKNSKTYI